MYIIPGTIAATRLLAQQDEENQLLAEQEQAGQQYAHVGGFTPKPPDHVIEKLIFKKDLNQLITEVEYISLLSLSLSLSLFLSDISQVSIYIYLIIISISH